MRRGLPWGVVMGAVMLCAGALGVAAKDPEKIPGTIAGVDVPAATFRVRPDAGGAVETIAVDDKTRFAGVASLAELREGQAVIVVMGGYHPVFGDWYAMEVQVPTPPQ